MLHVGFGLLVNRNLVPDCEDHPPHLPQYVHVHVPGPTVVKHVGRLRVWQFFPET